MVATCPCRAAKSSGVQPNTDRSLIVAPASSSKPRRLGVAVVRRPHQRRLLLPPFLHVHLGAARQQHTHRVDLADARRGHQRRLAFGQRGVGIGARVQQQLDHRRVAVERGGVERRHAVAVDRLDVGAASHQQRGRLQVIEVGRHVQRRRAVGRGGLCRARLLQEPAHRRQIAGLHGIHERHCRPGGHRRAGRRGGECRQREPRLNHARPHPLSRSSHLPHRALP